jgi:hypothetical protein
MTTSLLIIAAVFVVAALVVLWSAGAARRRRAWASALLGGVLALALVAGAALAVVGAIGIQGYRALTRETVAATVTTQPLGPEEFRATIQMPDGRLAMYNLAGDAFYIDAHILKWRPVLNLLGLHTAYQLDRVAGRYDAVAAERTRPRTVYDLARPKPVDLFDLARRYRLLKPLVDAQYGSASFVAATRPARFEVRVSTSGLLIRGLPPPP